MSQNYIVTNDGRDEKSSPIVTISNKAFELTDVPEGHTLISAGSVTFTKNSFGSIEAQVTHGKLPLGITVDLNQMEDDKQLIEKLFL